MSNFNDEYIDELRNKLLKIMENNNLTVENVYRGMDLAKKDILDSFIKNNRNPTPGTIKKVAFWVERNSDIEC